MCLFAQDIALFNLVLQGGSFAVVTYLMLWGLPRLRQEIAKESKVERDDFKMSLEILTSTFKDEMKAERVACEARFDKLAETIHILSHKMPPHAKGTDHG
jgi:hypothetical protein